MNRKIVCYLPLCHLQKTIAASQDTLRALSKPKDLWEGRWSTSIHSMCHTNSAWNLDECCTITQICIKFPMERHICCGIPFNGTSQRQLQTVEGEMLSKSWRGNGSLYCQCGAA